MAAKKRPAKAIESNDCESAGGTEEVQPMKRPSKKASVTSQDESVHETTIDLVKNQIGKEDSAIDEFWNKLSKREQQSLWKRFETQRQQDGTAKDYQDITKGIGRNQKALSLMKVYLKVGSTKHPAWMQSMASLRTSESYKETEQWIPLEGALKKYGATELKARVEAGTIQVRRSLTDSRFPEFLDEQQVYSRKTEHEKTRTGTLDQKCKWEDFAALSKLKVKGFQDLDFLEDQDEHDDEDGSPQEADALTLAKSMLDPKGKKEADMAKQALKQFETASALAEKKGTIPDKALLDGKKKLRAHLKKVLGKVQDEGLKTDVKKALSTLEEIDQGTAPGVVKRALNDAALVGKRALKSLDG